MHFKHQRDGKLHFHVNQRNREHFPSSPDDHLISTITRQERLPTICPLSPSGRCDLGHGLGPPQKLSKSWLAGAPAAATLLRAGTARWVPEAAWRAVMLRRSRSASRKKVISSCSCAAWLPSSSAVAASSSEAEAFC